MMQKSRDYALFENHPKNRQPVKAHVDRLKADKIRGIEDV
jgi:hypothetical protein